MPRLRCSLDLPIHGLLLWVMVTLVLMGQACVVVKKTPVVESTTAGAELEAGAEVQAPPETGSAKARFGMEFEPVLFEPPAVNHAELANGITLDHYAEMEIPLVTVLVCVRVGSIDDPPGKTGAAALAGQVIRNGGSGTLDGDQLDRELEARGAELSVETDRELTWFRLSLLQEDLAWGMDILRDLLADPAMPQTKLEEARGRWLVDLSQRLDVPMQVARAVFPQLVYGKGNPWGWTETSQTLETVEIDDLRAIYARYYHPSRMKLGLVGAVDWDQAQAEARRAFGGIDPGEAVPVELPPVEPIDQTRVYIVPRDVSQNVIYFGHEGVNRFDPQKFPIRVFNSVLSGGFTSRLFKEIRSNRGLAYSVFGRLGEGTRKGVYFNVAMTKAESSTLTLQLMLDINRDLCQEPPTPDEIELARQSDVNSFVFFFDTSEKILRQNMILDLHDYPDDYLHTYVDRLKAVQPDEVRQAAQSKIHLDRIVVLVVGKVDAVLRERLEALGPITEISDEQLRAQWL